MIREYKRCFELSTCDTTYVFRVRENGLVEHVDAKLIVGPLLHLGIPTAVVERAAGNDLIVVLLVLVTLQEGDFGRHHIIGVNASWSPLGQSVVIGSESAALEVLLRRDGRHAAGHHLLGQLSAKGVVLLDHRHGRSAVCRLGIGFHAGLCRKHCQAGRHGQ